MDENLKVILIQKIDTHFRNAETFCQIIEHASRDALAENTGEQIRGLSERISIIEEELNKTKSLKSFVIDIGISVLLSQGVGYFAMHGLNTMCKTIISNRKLAEKALTEVRKLRLKTTKDNFDKAIKDLTEKLQNHALFPEFITKMQLHQNRVLKDLEKSFKNNSKIEKFDLIKHYGLITPIINDILQSIDRPIWDLISQSESKDRSPYLDLGVIDSNALAFFSSSASNYLIIQRSTNVALSRFYKNFLAEIDNKNWIKLLILIFESFEDFPQNGRDQVVIKSDLSFMYRCFLFILTYGHPSKWSRSADEDGHFYESPTLIRNKKESYYNENYKTFEYKIYFSKETQKIILGLKGGSFMEGKSFLEYYRSQKMRALKRNTGLGIDEREGHEISYMGDVLPKRGVDAKDSLEYTAYEYAFYHTKEWFRLLYLQIERTQNEIFTTITQNLGK